MNVTNESYIESSKHHTRKAHKSSQGTSRRTTQSAEKWRACTTQYTTMGKKGKKKAPGASSEAAGEVGGGVGSKVGSNDPPGTIFHAARQGDNDFIQEAIMNGVDVNEKDSTGERCGMM